jgi:hypothetical protein
MENCGNINRETSIFDLFNKNNNMPFLDYVSNNKFKYIRRFGMKPICEMKAVFGIVDKKHPEKSFTKEGTYKEFQEALEKYSASQENDLQSLKPKLVVYNGRSTICIWEDNSVTAVTATEDEIGPTHELGVAMCVVKKVFGNRQEFMRLVDSGYEAQPLKVK